MASRYCQSGSGNKIRLMQARGGFGIWQDLHHSVFAGYKRNSPVLGIEVSIFSTSLISSVASWHATLPLSPMTPNYCTFGSLC